MQTVLRPSRIEYSGVDIEGAILPLNGSGSQASEWSCRLACEAVPECNGWSYCGHKTKCSKLDVCNLKSIPDLTRIKMAVAGPGRCRYLSSPSCKQDSAPLLVTPLSPCNQFRFVAEVGWTSGITPEHADVSALLRGRGMQVLETSSMRVGLREPTLTLEIISPKVFSIH